MPATVERRKCHQTPAEMLARFGSRRSNFTPENAKAAAQLALQARRLKRRALVQAFRTLERTGTPAVLEKRLWHALERRLSKLYVRVKHLEAQLNQRKPLPRKTQPKPEQVASAPSAPPLAVPLPAPIPKPAQGQAPSTSTPAPIAQD